MDAFSIWRTRFCIYPHQGNSLRRKVAEETIISYRVFTGPRRSIQAQRVLVVAAFSVYTNITAVRDTFKKKTLI